MTVQLNPYLNFRDQTKSAMEFYKTVFGGELTLQTFKDFHAGEASEGDKIMHAQLLAEGGMVLMSADTPDSMEYKPGSNFSISLSGDNEPKLSEYFQKLADGGSVTMPLEKAAWGDVFGMVKDKFGISWLVNISAPKN